MNDILLSMQRGAATEALARQFGLGEEQARLAVAALMPAFAFGLREPASGPDPFGAQAWMRRVAEQAGAMSGLNASLLQSMMPAVAAMMLGAYARATGDADVMSPPAMSYFAASGLPDTHPMAQLMRMMQAGMTEDGSVASPDAVSPQAGLAAMTRMFDAGRTLQESQIAVMQDLFDAFLRPPGQREPK